MDSTAIVRHTKIKATANPFLDEAYFQKRKFDKGMHRLTGKFKMIWKNQNGLCYHCEMPMLNQANGDRQILAKQLNISPHQLSYVTHSGEGEGLLFFGNVILPFVDHFPKDLELYRILTTRLSEVAEAQKHE